MNWHRGLVIAIPWIVAGMLLAQAPPEKKSFPPDQSTRESIRKKMQCLKEKLVQVEQRLSQASQTGTQFPFWVYADIAVFYKAALWILQQSEWYRPEYARWTLELLDRGVRRAEDFLQSGKASWLKSARSIVLGYSSALDGSVQPYAVTLPRDFWQRPLVKRRLDVILHGRDATLTEVKFLYQHEMSLAKPQRDYVELHVYGRGNNAYRWAGESDVFEAVRDWAKRFPEAFDADRVVLRGFSMGGAGAWHLGLHYPHLWCSVSPGAGFTTTRGYVQGLPDPLPAYQEACLKIYDAVEYAENAFNVPIVAYGGELDPQLQAAKNIDARLKPLGIPMTLIIGPKTAHRYHPDSLKTILELQGKHAQAGRAAYPERVLLVSYHPQYATAHWLTLVPEKMYELSRVEARWDGEQYELATKNVFALQIRLPPAGQTRSTVRCHVDGQSVAGLVDEVTDISDWLPKSHKVICLRKHEGRWQALPASALETFCLRQRRKTAQAAGPIDQAFCHPFVCVIGTGAAWHPRVQEYCRAELARFQREWSKYFRGELPVVEDSQVSSALLASKNVILFGDPGSNRILASILNELPLKWGKETLEFAGRSYSAGDHVPVLCYASPFGAHRLVVINSGHTFHTPHFEGTNALLFPRLGDYAILRLPAKGDPLTAEVVRAGLFDIGWRLPNAE